MSKYKTIDVIYNGKPLKKIYPHATGWQVFKYRVAKGIRWILILILRVIFWASIIFLAIWAIRHYWPHVEYEVVEREVIIDNLSNKVEEMKGEIISDIRKGESQGKVDCSGLLIFDVNKQASIGCYQFQIKTVIYYSEKFYGQKLTQKEAITLAMDDERAAALTKEIVFREKEGWRNWYNTSKKYGVPERLTLLASLQK